MGREKVTSEVLAASVDPAAKGATGLTSQPTAALPDAPPTTVAASSSAMSTHTFNLIGNYTNSNGDPIKAAGQVTLEFSVKSGVVSGTMTVTSVALSGMLGRQPFTGPPISGTAPISGPTVDFGALLQLPIGL
jgi:hypothetical protein